MALRTQSRIRNSFVAWVKMQLHLVIPAFSNCFFIILQPIKALTAAARIVPASMITRIHVVPVLRMVSIYDCSVPLPSMVFAQPSGSAKNTR